MSRADEPFAMFPHRFIDAEMRGDLSDRQAKLCRFIVRNAFQGRAKLSLAQIATGLRWEWSEDTLLRELKALRPQWIDYESRPGQRDAYLIRLTGLARGQKTTVPSRSELGPEARTSAPPPHHLRRTAEKKPPHREVGEPVESGTQSGKQPPQKPPSDSTPSPLSSYLYEGSEVKASSEEKLDHALGETTTGDPVGSDTDRLLAKMEELDRRKHNRQPASVDQADDRSLVWSGEALEGEASVLADCYALVNAGLGEWIEDDAEAER